MGTGPLHVPKLPGHPRHRVVRGSLVPHQSVGLRLHRRRPGRARRWTSSPTSASPSSAPVPPRCSAFRTSPRACRELYVFQRTPSSVDVRDNRPTDPEWFADIATPGWQQRWLENFAATRPAAWPEEDLVMDGWTDLARRVRSRIMSLPPDQFTPENMMAAFEDYDFEKMSEIRARVDAIVEDPNTAAEPQGVVPPTLQAARASTTSTSRRTTSRAPSRSTPTARASNGSPRTAWSSRASSTKSTASSTRRGSRSARRTPVAHGYDMTGRDGLKLSEYWAGGMRTMHGIHVHGFPNVFIVQLSQGASLDLERAAQLHRSGQDDRDDDQARARPRLRRDRSDQGSRRTRGSTSCSPVRA